MYLKTVDAFYEQNITKYTGPMSSPGVFICVSHCSCAVLRLQRI